VPAYMISEVPGGNAGAIQTYRNCAAPSMARHGGRYLSCGGMIEPLEGSRMSDTIIVADFPDMDQARAFYYSPENATRRRSKTKHPVVTALVVDGVSVTL
jgi:uncharacterized protein (DUF1330 family)